MLENNLPIDYDNVKMIVTLRTVLTFFKYTLNVVVYNIFTVVET